MGIPEDFEGCSGGLRAARLFLSAAVLRIDQLVEDVLACAST